MVSLSKNEADISYRNSKEYDIIFAVCTHHEILLTLPNEGWRDGGGHITLMNNEQCLGLQKFKSEYLKEIGLPGNVGVHRRVTFGPILKKWDVVP
jgi:hypothetical protein